MTAAIIGLAGVGLGAVMALFGSALSDRRHARQEAAQWRRDQRAAAYEQALYYLGRAANRRSRLIFGATGSRTLMGGEQVADWLSDLAEAQHWLRVLITRCGPAQMCRLPQVAGDLESSCNRPRHRNEPGDAKRGSPVPAVR
jgi:ferredoxin-NADP reductase